MKVGKTELENLAQIIIKNIKEEFAIKHLSGNLENTITVEDYGNEIKINIPAQTYNMLLYQQKGVVVHTSHGSYASRLDEEGSSFMVYPNGSKAGSHRISPGNHKGFLDKTIDQSIQEWMGLVGRNKVKKVEG